MNSGFEKVKRFSQRIRQEEPAWAEEWEVMIAEAMASDQAVPAMWTAEERVKQAKAKGEVRTETMLDLGGLCVLAARMGNLKQFKNTFNREIDKLIGERAGRRLPPPITAQQLQAKKLSPPPQVIEGILHQGSKMVFGGNSKAFKTWQLLHLALAVSTGSQWQGHRTTMSPVLYINLELEPWAISERLAALQKAVGLTEIPEALRVWNLRDELAKLEDIIEDVSNDGGQHGLVVVDPVYSLLTGKDEIGTESVSEVCALLGVLAKTTGGAVVWGGHFAKGNSASKSPLDRISGSGVWARNPDTIMTATEHERNDCYTVEVTVRNLPKIQPYVIEWQYPLFVRQSGLNPENLRQKSGRAATYKPDAILPLLPSTGATTSEWCKAVTAETGMTRSTFYKLFAELKNNGKVERQQDGWQEVR